MRGRSKSIVQKIALDVPTYTEDALNLGLETISAQRRSRSTEPKHSETPTEFGNVHSTKIESFNNTLATQMTGLATLTGLAAGDLEEFGDLKVLDDTSHLNNEAGTGDSVDEKLASSKLETTGTSSETTQFRDSSRNPEAEESKLSQLSEDPAEDLEKTTEDNSVLANNDLALLSSTSLKESMDISPEESVNGEKSINGEESLVKGEESLANHQESSTTGQESLANSSTNDMALPQEFLPLLTNPSLMTPLTSADSQSLWSAYTSTFNYNCLLPSSSIDAISALSTNQFQNFQTTCSTNKSNLLNIITSTNSLIASTDSLLAKYNQISHETSEFDATSSKLLSLETSYSTKLSQIEGYLQHFENLETITKNLSRSGFNLIQRHQYFSDEILVQLDSSLDFFAQHENFRDIETYTSRFRQCMTRGLTLIKNYLVLELKEIDEKVYREEENFNLLVYNEFLNYIKFHGDEFNLLIQEIVSRISNHHEYLGLLKDVLANYFRIRRNLVSKYLENERNLKNSDKNEKLSDKNEKNHNSSEKLSEKNISASLNNSSTSLTDSIDSPKSNFVQIFQDQISYYKTIVEKEFNLFKKLFVLGPIPNYMEQEFYQFLAELLEPLYDNLRYLILRESKISKLCQVTTLLQKYYEFEEFSDDFSRRSSVNFEVLTINYGDLFQNILHDVQTRLIFRIQLYVDDKLMGYKPEPEDLMFDVRVGGRRRKIDRNGGSEKDRSSEKNSEKNEKDGEILTNTGDVLTSTGEGLTNSNKILTNTTEDSKTTETNGEESDSLAKDSSASLLNPSLRPLDIDYPDNLFPNVYPPLAKALTLLSNIYELINSMVFDDLAHYIVHSCIILLKGPFYSLSLTHLGLVDTQLLYLQNLILLKSQVTNFDIQFTRNDFSIDFTGGLTSGFSAVWTLIRRGEFTFNDGFLELARKSVPKVVNDMIDANLEIELELENVVREFVEEGGRRICEPLNEKLSEKSANSEKSVANSSEKNVANSSEGANSTNSNTPLITITAFKDNLLIMIPNYHQQIKLFIKDPQIVNFLLESLTNVILVTYEKYVVSLEEEREEDFMEVDALSVFLEDLTSQN
jgi:hypothetical protein